MTAEEVTSSYIVHHVKWAPMPPLEYSLAETLNTRHGSFIEVSHYGKHTYIGERNKVQTWWVDGKISRDDGSALAGTNADGNGFYVWYRDGKLHRDDGPAVKTDSVNEWYRDGKLHRDDGPAVKTDSANEWYRDGKLHRDDGPSIIRANGANEWYRDGKRHREGGPAVRYRFYTPDYALGSFPLDDEYLISTDDPEATPDMKPGFFYQYWHDGEPLDKTSDDFGEKLVNLIYPDHK